jgi:5,10-methylene-tetrahydrofolate dehydrogenase/methenyl tetrahydrofolate cyclohydrolase
MKEKDLSGLFTSPKYNSAKIQIAANKRVRFGEWSAIEEQNVKKNEEYLNSIVNLSKQNGLHLILVAFPVYTTFKDQISPSKIQLRQKKLATLTEKRPKLVWMNFEDSGIPNIIHFKNDNHLNHFGAKLFTTAKNHSIKKQLE